MTKTHTYMPLIQFYIFLTIRQGVELIPSNIEIPQGTKATQLHRKGLQLIAAYILESRK